MKVVILYRPNSDHARSIETFVHDFQRRYSDTKLELVNIDERDGIALASLYDVMSYPAIMVMATDGVILEMWQGTQLPLIDQVASYALHSYARSRTD